LYYLLISIDLYLFANLIPKEENAESKSDDDTFMPFFFEEKKEESNDANNIIEEVKEEAKEDIFDPMDAVIKLDPNYDKIVEEAKGLDLKTAINEVRELVNSLQQKGFDINLEEVDITGNYQMTINIKNKD